MGKGKREQEKPKRLCCSKKIVYIAWAVLIVLLAAFLYGLFFTEKDMSVMSIVLGADSVVTGAATGFYFWKAKAEKKLELFERMAAKWEEKYGIEAVSNLASIILSE